MVSYVGSTAARALLHDHELWLSPESLDSRSSFLQKQGLPAKVKDHSTLNLCHQHLRIYMVVMAHICRTLQHSFGVHGVQRFCPISGSCVKAIFRLWCDKKIAVPIKEPEKSRCIRALSCGAFARRRRVSKYAAFGFLGCCLKVWLMYFLCHILPAYACPEGATIASSTPAEVCIRRSGLYLQHPSLPFRLLLCHACDIYPCFIQFCCCDITCCLVVGASPQARRGHHQL